MVTALHDLNMELWSQGNMWSYMLKVGSRWSLLRWHTAVKTPALFLLIYYWFITHFKWWNLCSWSSFSSHFGFSLWIGGRWELKEVKLWLSGMDVTMDADWMDQSADGCKDIFTRWSNGRSVIFIRFNCTTGDNGFYSLLSPGDRRMCLCAHLKECEQDYSSF